LNWLAWIPLCDRTLHNWAAEARLLRWLTLIWLVIGLITLFSASYPVALAKQGNGLQYIQVQLLWVFLGLLLFKAVVHTCLDRLLRLSGIALLLILGLILLTLTPALGVTVNGATRWLPLGPFLLQPSELIKPLLILQAARLFGQWHQLGWLTRLLWLSIFGAVLGAILLQPNLSTAAICGLLVWSIALAAGLPYRYLGLTALGGLSAAAISLLQNPYQRQRITAFIDPWTDPAGSGYQLIQSLLTIGSGGVWGQGYGMSQQKLSYLPIQYTDFIFSVYAEEFGLIGGVMLLLLLATYASVALLVAYRARHALHRLVAVGAMVLLVGQSLMNMAVATGLLPTTGLPLPLFSYGGSSMISSLLTAALLVRVAREIHGADVMVLPTTATMTSSSKVTPLRRQ